MFKEKNCVMSEENEALAYRLHMDIFQKGDLLQQMRSLLLTLFGEIQVFLQN
jgi:hypothetical protein